MFRFFDSSRFKRFREQGLVLVFSFLRPLINHHSQTTMQRHRMIYSALSEEFAQGLHALSLKTKTEREFESVQI